MDISPSSNPRLTEFIERALLTDPQTSGGLLVACAPDAVGEVLRAFSADGFDPAALVGSIFCGPPRVVIHPGAGALADVPEQTSVA